MSAKTLRLVFVLLILSANGCHYWGGYATFSKKIDLTPYLKRAQENSQAGKFSEAIEDYETHIKNRLQALALTGTNPATGENPYFYKALIGDLYLKLDQPEEAKQAYLQAYEHEVSNEIVVDRIRQLAKWHREHGNPDAAQTLLHEYRHLDPLMFDYDLDRLHREIIRDEDEKATTSGKDVAPKDRQL